MGIPESTTQTVPLGLTIRAVSRRWWVYTGLKIILAGLGLSLVLGQAVRLPLLGQAGGLLISDVAVVVVLQAAIAFLGTGRVHTRTARIAWRIFLCTVPFVIWGLSVLLVNRLWLTTPELFIAAAYWLRVTTYLLLIPALLILCSNYALQNFLTRTLMYTIAALVVLGGVQQQQLPSLDVLGGGWDPHPGRLVSTWLDPNFLGGFFGVSLLWIAYEIGRATRTHRRAQFFLIGIAAGFALILTQSRSSLVALVLAVVVTSPLYTLLRRRPPTIHTIVTIGASAALGLSLLAIVVLLAPQRWQGLAKTDATVSLRAKALTEVAYVIADHPWVGVGFNAYQFAAARADLTEDFSLHSRAGSDSSLFTLWVTTGLIGLVLFSLPWAIIASTALFRAFTRRDIFLLLFVTSLMTWGIHAQFVNSGLYVHQLLVMAIITALILSRVPQKQHQAS